RAGNISHIGVGALFQERVMDVILALAKRDAPRASALLRFIATYFVACITIGSRTILRTLAGAGAVAAGAGAFARATGARWLLAACGVTDSTSSFIAASPASISFPIASGELPKSVNPLPEPSLSPVTVQTTRVP